MDLNYKKIGKKIKRLRQQQKLSQEIFAEKCNLSSSYISYIEQGHKKISLNSIVKIAEFLNVAVDLLLNEQKLENLCIEQKLNILISDCDFFEKQIIYDVANTTKDSIRRNIKLD